MRWRRWTTWPTTLAPAVLARETSSPSGSRGSAFVFGSSTPTRMARSCLTERWERVSDKGWFLREGYRHYMSGEVGIQKSEVRKKGEIRMTKFEIRINDEI